MTIMGEPVSLPIKAVTKGPFPGESPEYKMGSFEVAYVINGPTGQHVYRSI